MAFCIGPYITDYGAEKYFNSKKKLIKAFRLGGMEKNIMFYNLSLKLKFTDSLRCLLLYFVLYPQGICSKYTKFIFLNS